MTADALSVAEAVRNRERSAREVTEEALDAARADQLGAVWLVTEERALAEADAVDAAIARGDDPGALAGVPVGWKDLIDTGGIRTTYGSALFRNHVPDRDADVVERLAAAGGICIAKLNTHELAWGTTSTNPHFGTCRNPHDTDRVPGGSSGGSGAAVAAGIVAVAPGTDTGGSIRCPASCCGIVGLKPTFGRVSLAGINPLCQSLDHCGPMTRSVRDSAAVLELLAGPSPRDPRAVPMPVEHYSEAVGRGVSGLTVGIAERYFFEHTAPDIAAQVREAIDALREAGAMFVEIDLGWPVQEIGEESFYLADEAGSMYQYWPQRRSELGDDVVADLERADRLSGVQAGWVSMVRLRYQARMLETMAERGIDLVVLPTQAQIPPRIGQSEVPFAGRDGVDVTTAMCGLTGVFNVLGWPAISVPCGTDAAGLPVGCQIAALPWHEADCLAAGAVVEAAMPSR
ncbi:MAG: aspartyl-tRNA(Asn)/glutamyl-tRNA(Gln) amidotransferase subunit [Gaiellales bacterium]|nr:aspartyl-tRNA(Asn)/glutamyl-tRNA(Gln) amidotransferase subunit [Gaiellales bacterium]